jgi:hypothetical protein
MAGCPRRRRVVGGRFIGWRFDPEADEQAGQQATAEAFAQEPGNRQTGSARDVRQPVRLQRQWVQVVHECRAAGPEHSRDLGESCAGILPVMQAEGRDDHVDRTGLEGQAGDVTDFEAQPIRAR